MRMGRPPMRASAAQVRSGLRLPPRRLPQAPGATLAAAHSCHPAQAAAHRQGAGGWAEPGRGARDTLPEAERSLADRDGRAGGAGRERGPPRGDERNPNVSRRSRPAVP